MVHKNNSAQTEATSIVLQINNTIQKIQNSCTLVKLKYHVNSSMADWTTTSLTEHFVSARLTETLVATFSSLVFSTPPLQSGPAFTSPAFPTLAVWCRIF